MSTMTETSQLTIANAINQAMHAEMASDESVIVYGEDVGKMGGLWGTLSGLQERFGEDRVRDTPISETAFIGAAVGLAATGMRPVVELMFVDFAGVCMDAIVNLAAKQSYMSGGNVGCPMVLMASVGGGSNQAGQQSQCLYATFGHLPGLKVVIPSNAYDAKGMMHAAVRDNNPVVFLFHKALQGLGWFERVETTISDVPSAPYLVPLDKASVTREGTDVTVVGLGMTVHHALEAAEVAAERGISVEVVDLRSIAPIDRETIRQSVRKTGRLIVVDEDYMSCGVSAEVIASVCEDPSVRFTAAPARIAYPDVPVPFAPALEQFVRPNAQKVVAAIEVAMGSPR